MPTIRKESSKIIVASLLGGLFMCQTKIPEKCHTSTVATPATLTTSVLSTVFEISNCPSTATFKRWQPHYTVISTEKSHENVYTLTL